MSDRGRKGWAKSQVQIPDFYLSQPGGWTPAEAAAFERLWAGQGQLERFTAIDYRLESPKWKFLCWLADTKDVLLHGSGRRHIRSFEPRRADDTSEFGGRMAVFAASDGIWAMFFAIANRRVARSLVNASFSVDEGGVITSFYYFSINADAFDGDPWQEGTVYVLPRSGFDRDVDEEWLGAQVKSHHWASAVPVRPMASLQVTPADFPFLDEVNAHHHPTVAARASEDPDGFPWRDQLQ